MISNDENNERERTNSDLLGRISLLHAAITNLIVLHPQKDELLAALKQVAREVADLTPEEAQGQGQQSFAAFSRGFCTSAKEIVQAVETLAGTKTTPRSH